VTRQATGTEAQIKDLDPSWKPASLRPKADAKIREVLTAWGEPTTVDEVMIQGEDQAWGTSHAAPPSDGMDLHAKTL
jgi:hypothetical protein